MAQDSVSVLKKVTVSTIRKKNAFTSTIPQQFLNKSFINKINAPTVGDAARFLSGVQVKDYGGVGGLKTISVRSLGAAFTGILYDGLPVADMQSGYTDLSRFSTANLQTLELYQPHPVGVLLPARAYAAAALLSMNSVNYYPSFNQASSWQASLSSGSFGFLQAVGGARLVFPDNLSVSVFSKGLVSEGNYPYTVNNGNASLKAERKNTAIRSAQAEVSLSKLFKDSAILQFHASSLWSERELPGAVIFFNERSSQTLDNKDQFLQVRYHNRLSGSTSLLFSGKFIDNYSRYRDPEYLNNAGGLDDIYNQQEIYFSAAVGRELGKNFSTSVSSDITLTNLKSNKNTIPRPERFSNWTNFLLAYTNSLLEVQGTLLSSFFIDKTEGERENANRFRLTPGISVGRKIHRESPFKIRLFYKETFRMPGFNDLYYHIIGNAGLNPEKSVQWNLGVAYSKQFNKKIRQINFSIDGYHNKVRDKIIAVPFQNLFSWTMLNLGKTDTKGIDLTSEANGSLNSNWHWNIRLSYTFQKAIDITDVSSSRYKNRLPYTPDHSGNFTILSDIKSWSAGYSLVFSGTRYALGENNPFNQLNGWGTQDLFLAKKFSFQLIKGNIKAELNNFTNLQYDVIRYYPMPGRSYKISLIIQP